MIITHNHLNNHVSIFTIICTSIHMIWPKYVTALGLIDWLFDGLIDCFDSLIVMCLVSRNHSWIMVHFDIHAIRYNHGQTSTSKQFHRYTQPTSQLTNTSLHWLFDALDLSTSQLSNNKTSLINKPTNQSNGQQTNGQITVHITWLWVL